MEKKSITLGFLSALTIAVVTASGLSAQQERPLATRAVPLDQLCGAQAVLVDPPMTIRIAGGSERLKKLFGPGEAVIVGAGSAQGLRPGQRYIARRLVDDRFAMRTVGQQPRSIHTAGWITILETQTDVSVATVTEACDGVIEGDYLEPLIIPAPPGVASVLAGEPDYARPAHVILGDERRQVGSPGSLMVMDRGTDHGLRVGQKLTVFRETLAGKGPVAKIGEAVVVTTHTETSLVRIVTSREAVYVGDLIAIHR